MKKSDFLKLLSAAFILATFAFSSLYAQSPGPVIVGGNSYAFYYSGGTNYGLYFNLTGTAYEFKDGAGATVFSVNANSGRVDANGTLYANSNIRFGAASDLLIDADRYAFRYRLGTNYGLFFNATQARYEFRNASASPVFWVGANTGFGWFGNGIRVGNSTSTEAGSIRYNGSDFQGYDGTNWVSFTSGGGPTSWTVSGNNQYSSVSGNVGIGTSTPSSKLQVVGTSGQSLEVLGVTSAGRMVNFEATSAPGSANDILQIAVPSGSPNDFQFIECERGFDIQFAVNGDGSVDFKGALRPNGSSGTSGHVLTSQGSGLPPVWAAATGGSLPSGTSGQTLRHDGTNWVANTHLFNSGSQVGIGTSTPLYPLHVEGSAMLSSGFPFLVLRRGSSTANMGIGFQTETGGTAGWISYRGSESRLYLTAQSAGLAPPDLVLNNNGNIGMGVAAANNRLTVSGSVDVSGNVGIGTTSPARKLDIQGDAASSSHLLISNVNFTGNSDVRAVEGYSIPAEGFGFGLYGTGGWRGVYGVNPAGAYTSSSFGVQGFSSGTAGTRYAVYGSTSGTGGTYFAGYFAGNVTVTGTFSNPSDARLKKNDLNLVNALDKLAMLQAKTYEFKTDEYDYMRLPEGRQFGFIAHEVAEVFPELVNRNVHPESREGDPWQNEALEYQSVNYMGLIPVMVEAIKEQKTIIEEKDSKIDALTNEVETMKAQMAQFAELLQSMNESLGACCNTHKLNGMSSSTDRARLEQNLPNPFNGTTKIGYYLPQNTTNAQLVVFDMKGQMIQTFPLSGSGNGSVEFGAGELPSGVYLYTLVVNGVKVDTKRMVLNR